VNDGDPIASRPDFDTAVDAFLLSIVKPSRRPEPRMAERLVSVEQHRVRSHGGMVSAWRLGADPAVLLIHGWEDNHSLWSPLIDSLADRGRSVIAVDMPAHGFSDGEWGLHPEAIDAVQAVSTALGPVDAVVAHSSGAGVAALAIMEGLPADRAVLIAPPLRGDDRFLRYAKRQGVPEDVAAAARAIYHERVGRDRAAMDLRAALPLLDVNLLLVHSTDDERMRFVDSREIVSLCPRADFFAVHGLAHRKTARDPEVVTRITGFVTA
jgi:pimeloyl-ACP methyl ester carboxylesterase